MRKRTFIRLAVMLIGGTTVGWFASSVVRSQQEAPAKYVGVDNCKMCHGDMHTNWAKTKHARAFTLLEHAGQAANAQCLPCHTTGYGTGGYVDEASTPGLKGVQCEACHGPGGNHMGDPKGTTRTPSAAVCAACHLKLNIH